MLKKLMSILLILSCFSLMAPRASAQTIDPKDIEMTYYIYDIDGNLIEQGIQPNYPTARYQWPGVRLLNGETVKFVPTHDSNGLYFPEGAHIQFSFNPSSGKLLQQFFINGVARDRILDIAPSGFHFMAGSWYTQSSGYIYAQFTNYSSDSMVIQNFKIVF